MTSLPRLVEFPDRVAAETEGTLAKDATALAYVHDPDSAAVVRQCFNDLGLTHGVVVTGGIEAAIKDLPERGWPKFLVLDITGTDDPMPEINRLAEGCDPETQVIVIGDRNDIVLYRSLKAAGVAEYFYKPLLGNLLARAITDLGGGVRSTQSARSGKLLISLGVRGGVGATMVATNLAWHLAEVRQRSVLLLDLDLYGGDAALQLDAQPSHALREALDDPGRIDELFLERAIVSVTKHLGLMASLEPFSQQNVVNEVAALELVQKLVGQFRYLIIDLPGEMARTLPSLLHLPSTVLLVSDGTLTALREVSRWREFLGPNTPDRNVLHVLNKKNADGAVPDEEMLRVVQPPDLSIPWDRDIMSAASLGTKATQGCSTIRHAMSAFSVRLSGAAPEQDHSLWQRIFG